MTITIIAAPREDCAPTPQGNQPGTLHLEPHMKLITGTLWSQSDAWVEDPLDRGLKLILVQSGELACRIPGQPVQQIKGPSLCTIVNDGEFTSSQIYGTDTPLRYTIVQLDLEALDRHLGLAPRRLLSATNGDPYMRTHAAPRAMQTLATQIATCPMQGPTRALYLGGKALELTALSAELLLGQAPQPPERTRINASEVERIHAARDHLVSALQEPPTLSSLAARVGMSPRKLTAGFRKVFGNSVFGYLQDHRLEVAHRMLTQEQSNVSTVAYGVGYSPAHFSIAFRKRYGVSPSEIR
ncbi:helix-turn-helix domain-containing protein [Pseudomonas putida]